MEIGSAHLAVQLREFGHVELALAIDCFAFPCANSSLDAAPNHSAAFVRASR